METVHDTCLHIQRECPVSAVAWSGGCTGATKHHCGATLGQPATLDMHLSLVPSSSMHMQACNVRIVSHNARLSYLEIGTAFVCPVDISVSCRYKGCYQETTFDGVACSSLEQRCFSCYCSIAVQTFAGFSYCKRYWLKYIIQVTFGLSAVDVHHFASCPDLPACSRPAAQAEQGQAKAEPCKQAKPKQHCSTMSSSTAHVWDLLRDWQLLQLFSS